MPTSFPKTFEERFEGQLRRLPQGTGMHVSRRSEGQRAKVLDSWRRCYLPWPWSSSPGVAEAKNAAKDSEGEVQGVEANPNSSLQ